MRIFKIKGVVAELREISQLTTKLRQKLSPIQQLDDPLFEVRYLIENDFYSRTQKITGTQIPAQEATCEFGSTHRPASTNHCLWERSLLAQIQIRSTAFGKFHSGSRTLITIKQYFSAVYDFVINSYLKVHG
jgi:hypothetical protein